MLIRCYKLDIHIHTLMTVKKTAAKYYRSTYETILHHLVTGSLLHVDETQVSIRGRTAYVWTFTNFHDVAYLYTDSREGAFLQEMLKDFKGVLISDFYAAYDLINCEQQKCLVHLMRDLNDSVLKHPYDEELKVVVREFAALLKVIVDTIDRRGLKARFLRKHQIDVDRSTARLLNSIARANKQKNAASGSRRTETSFSHSCAMTASLGTTIMRSTLSRRFLSYVILRGEILPKKASGIFLYC